MISTWIGIAVLAVSWLWGLGLFYPESGLWWGLATVAGTALSCIPRREAWNIDTKWLWWTLALMLPATWLLPWPWMTGPLLVALGAAVGLVPGGRWRDAISSGCIIAGVTLLAQAVAISVYIAQTAGSHDLPWLLQWALGGLLQVFGFDAVPGDLGATLLTTRQPHRLALTWELLVDPATFCFFLGALAAFGVAAWTQRPRPAFAAWRKAAVLLAVICVAWLPVRMLLLVAVYIQRVVRTSPDAPLHAMNHIFSPWVLLALLVVPVFVAWRLVRWGDNALADTAQAEPFPRETAGPAWQVPASLVLVALAAALAAAGHYWTPIGPRKEGRVMVVERHSTWEPTTRAYDTTWYGEPSSYNYVLMYDELSHYYSMSQLLEKDAIDDKTLAGCDVLVIKTPTARYTPAEVAAVQRFVDRGGGLLLIGDHTNLWGSTTTMNDITRKMGFIFRDDLLFNFGDETYEESYSPPWVPHPALAHMPPLAFAVSCSIDPGASHGRPMITGTGLWSMGPYYHAMNFHPVPEHCPEMRGGAFIQTWAAEYGKGRVLAFADSTLFSNFCVMQEGKAELMFGMVEWLNRAQPMNPRPWLYIMAVLLLVGGLRLMFRIAGAAWLAVIGALCLGFALGGTTTAALQRRAMRPPDVSRPFTQVVIEREISDAPLSNGANTTGGGKGFGLLEQWIPRLGYFSVRRTGNAVFSGDVLVVINPHKAVGEDYRRQLEAYVRGGGKLLVIDSTDNTATTANSLLWLFGLSLAAGEPVQGPVKLASGWPSVEVSRAWEIEGGEALATVGSRPVAAYTQFGKGAVMAVGFGNAFNDQAMGEHWMLEPSADTKLRYETLYALVRRLVEDKPIIAPKAAATDTSAPAVTPPPDAAPLDLPPLPTPRNPRTKGRPPKVRIGESRDNVGEPKPDIGAPKEEPLGGE